MARRFLDKGLILKIAAKLGKEESLIRSLISKKASKFGISSEAALVLLAKEQSIGAAVYQRSLDPSKQKEVSDRLQTIVPGPSIPKPASKPKNGPKAKVVLSKRESLKFAIQSLIEDLELRSRCQDLLLASGKYDRAINQATLVLEDRIRTKAEPPRKMVGEALVNFAFNEDLSKTVLRVESSDADDQRGFTQILRGVVAAFRNKTHHHVVDAFSREEALRVCGFIDVLLRVVKTAVKV